MFSIRSDHVAGCGFLSNARGGSACDLGFGARKPENHVAAGQHPSAQTILGQSQRNNLPSQAQCLGGQGKALTRDCGFIDPVSDSTKQIGIKGSMQAVLADIV